MTVKELLKDKLSAKELKHVPSSFEVIGSKEKAVAIVELPYQIKPKAGMVAGAIMAKHKNVKTVLLKESPRQGTFRTRKYRVIKGLKDTEVIHVENGCRLLVDPQSVYFSQREGTERQRIVDKVNENESVMVFFAGLGPYAIEIARKKKVRRVVGIEINPIAVDYFSRNIKLNKLDNVEVILGDVAERSKEFHGQFDRVIMPLPESASEYIRDAVDCLKQNGICHMYFFESEDKIDRWKKRVRDIVKSMKKKVKILEIKRVLPYSPGTSKYRMDFQII